METLIPQRLKLYSYFSHLSDGALEELSKKFQYTEIPAGIKIIREGEAADSFYLIESGELEVTKKTKFNQEAKITTLKCTEAFGEMALLTCSPRNSTITTLTDVSLYKLLKRDFEEVLQLDATFSNMLDEKIRDRSIFNKMKTLQPFALLEPEKMLTLSDKLEEKNYAPGENIIVQGEKGDAYFIVKSGSVAVLKKKGEDDPVQVATLSSGEAFGEEALIREDPRNATVQAIDNASVLRLDKKDFDDILKEAFLEWDFPEEVEEVRDKYFIIDARITPEYEEEHIKGAVNIPIEVLRQKYSELDPSLEYLTYCTNDSRGMTAAFLMRSQGFNVKSIRGGLSAWDGPVVQGGDGIHTPLSDGKEDVKQ